MTPQNAPPVSVGGGGAPADGVNQPDYAPIQTESEARTTVEPDEDGGDGGEPCETKNKPERSEGISPPGTGGAREGGHQSGGGSSYPHNAEGGRSGVGGGAPEQRRRRSRLLSYVMPGDSFNEDPPDAEAAERRGKVDEAGVRRVMESEKAAGREPSEMDHGNKGYDIKSFDEDRATLLRYIEVKSLGGDWDADGVKLTVSQFESAEENGDRYWLYVVERAEKDDFTIHRIKNPAAQVMYYVFDAGWAGLSEAGE